MKEIKDIGLPIGQVTRLPWTDSGIVTTTTTASDIPLGRFYTDEERRELVRRVLQSMFAEIEASGQAFDAMDKKIIAEDIEAFIKRERL